MSNKIYNLLGKSPNDGFMHVSVPRYFIDGDLWSIAQARALKRAIYPAADDVIFPLFSGYSNKIILKNKQPELVFVGAGPSARTQEAEDEIRSSNAIIVAGAVGNNVLREKGIIPDIFLLTGESLKETPHKLKCLIDSKGNYTISPQTIHILSTVVDLDVETALKETNAPILWYRSSSIQGYANCLRIGDSHGAGGSFAPVIAATGITNIKTYGLDLGTVLESEHEGLDLGEKDVVVEFKFNKNRACQSSMLAKVSEDFLLPLAHFYQTIVQYGEDLNLTMKGNNAAQETLRRVTAGERIVAAQIVNAGSEHTREKTRQFLTSFQPQPRPTP